MPAPREPNTVQPWDRPCLHWGLAWNHAMMTKDGLIFEANSLKQGRLQALTRQQLQAQATQNRERRWVAGAVAPKAKIVVYFAPNTAQGFVNVFNHAVHDSDHNPSVISTSWGSAENPTDPTTKQIDQILQDAASMGVTLCAASGDSGSRDNPNNPDQAAVDFPASSPSALGCGGTALRVSGTKIAEEVVWEDHS